MRPAYPMRNPRPLNLRPAPPASTDSDRLALIEAHWREAGCGDADKAWLIEELKRRRAPAPDALAEALLRLQAAEAERDALRLQLASTGEGSAEICLTAPRPERTYSAEEVARREQEAYRDGVHDGWAYDRIREEIDILDEVKRRYGKRKDGEAGG